MTDPLDLLGALLTARHRLDRVHHLRAKGQAGHADLCAAQHAVELALHRCHQAGVLTPDYLAHLDDLEPPEPKLRECLACGVARPLTLEHYGRTGDRWDQVCEPCRTEQRTITRTARERHDTQLEDRRRAIAELRDQGLTLAEVAARLQVPLSTVTNAVYRRPKAAS